MSFRFLTKTVGSLLLLGIASIGSGRAQGPTEKSLSPAERRTLQQLEDAWTRTNSAAQRIYGSADRTVTALMQWMEAVTKPASGGVVEAAKVTQYLVEATSAAMMGRGAEAAAPTAKVILEALKATHPEAYPFARDLLDASVKAVDAYKKGNNEKASEAVVDFLAKQGLRPVKEEVKELIGKPGDKVVDVVYGSAKASTTIVIEQFRLAALMAEHEKALRQLKQAADEIDRLRNVRRTTLRSPQQIEQLIAELHASDKDLSGQTQRQKKPSTRTGKKETSPGATGDAHDTALDDAVDYLNYLDQGDRYFEGRPDDFAKFLDRHPEFKRSNEAAYRAPDTRSSNSSASGGLVRAGATNVQTGDDQPILKDRGPYTPFPRNDLKGTADELRTGEQAPPRAQDGLPPSGRLQEARSLGMEAVVVQPSGPATTQDETQPRPAEIISTNGAPRLRTRRATDPQQEILRVQREYEHYLREELEYTAQVKGHLNGALRQLGETILENYAKAKYGDSGEFHAQNIETLIDLIRSANGREASEALAKRVADWFASKLKGVAGLTPDLFDTLMQLLTLQQDQKQREALDRWRESIEQRRAFWSRELQKQQAERGRARPPEPRPPSTDPVTEGLSRAGIRVTSASDAAAQGRARISGVARQGFSLTDIQVANLTSDWLAIDFSGSFFQPSNNSGSQRIGLVSAASSTAAFVPEHTRRILLASLAPTGLPLRLLAQNRHPGQTQSRVSTMTPGLYAKNNWVVVEPHSSGSVAFNSVCLDRSRGVPHQGEQFTVSSVPLPGRLERLLVTAAYNGSVPQSEVWGTIARERISWFDARTGYQVQSAFVRGDYDSVISLGRELLEAKAEDPELIRMMGLSLYRQGLRERSQARALDYLSQSADFLLDAVDLGLAVSLAVKHHKGFVGFENLVSATITVSRSEIKLETETNREFLSSRLSVTASEPTDKPNRISIVVSDGRGKNRTYNVYPEGCGAAKEAISIPPARSIELTKVSCSSTSQAASGVLARVLRGQ